MNFLEVMVDIDLPSITEGGLQSLKRYFSCSFNSIWEPAIDSEQLQLEIDRIPTRNLGRDDRIISSHGKETRHPFLSLDVVAFLVKLPVHHKMDPRLKVGLGDKILLRLAMRKLGLELVSTRKKRAMQFGSHSARMEGERRGDIYLDQASSM
jgi:asparagine synthetase B (glutamine-hydrolysing)